MTSEFIRVAEAVLESQMRPMSAMEIVDFARDNRMFSDNIAGLTPHQTLKSKLSVDIRRNGEVSKFVRTSPGRFYLRSLIGQEVVGQSNSMDLFWKEKGVTATIYEARRYQKREPQEQVLVFPSKFLDQLGRFQGIKKRWKRIYRAVSVSSECFYMDRLEAEQNDDHKQVLTYILITRQGRLLAFKRGIFNRVEDFLKGSDCVGFGGHVAADDVNLLSEQDYGIIECARRELMEELQLPVSDISKMRDIGPSIIGVLNDDSSAVGRRHFAFVLQYEVSDSPEWDNPTKGEKSITQLRWLDADGAPPPIWKFEYWSQLCLREFFPKLADTNPAYVIRHARSLKPPNLLCVCGPVGSGKSEATAVLSGDFGYREINSGRVVARILGVPPVPDTPREKFQALALQFIRGPGGPEALARAILAEAQEIEGKRILVDGIRQIATLDELKRQASPARVGILYVHTLPDLAFKFMEGREFADIHIDDFIAVRSAPVEGEVEKIIRIADGVVYNWHGIQRYRRAVKGMMRYLLGTTL